MSSLLNEHTLFTGISKHINQDSDSLMRWWIASSVVSYSVASLRNKFGFALTATIIFSHIANWSADAPLGWYRYGLVPYECASNFKSNSSSIPFFDFLLHYFDQWAGGTYVVPK